MATRSQSYGKSTLRWQRDKDGGFSGVVISGGKRGEIFHDADENRLVTRLKNEAGKLEPNYVGMDGAIERFLSFMPGGLRGERSRGMERGYKVTAHQQLCELLPLEKALEADEEDAAKLRRAPIWLNLLSLFETMHFKQTLENKEGPALIRACARFAKGEYSEAATAMHRALRKYGNQSWPKATYLPYLWAPTQHMFCKPQVTKDFAQRIGHEFQYHYDSQISEVVYLSLLDLAQQTLAALRPLGAEDFIDVQSFIYVVGAYQADDLPA